MHDFIDKPKVRRLLARGPVVLHASDRAGVLAFRCLLELAMCEWRWSGWTAEVS